MKFFEDIFQITDETKILDVGGTDFNWAFIKSKPQITLLNISYEKTETQGHIKKIPGDGRLLPFSDQSFDIVFSNSVIEHVSSETDQKIFAAEIRRVGKSYFVQTPNRNFPVEPHLLTGIMNFADIKATQDMIDSLSPLDFLSMKSLFPDAKIHQERFCGLSRSLIAIRNISNSNFTDD